MRICSLVPGATEVVAALGLAPNLVGISHECDYPPSVRDVPVMVHPRVESHRLTSAAIDAEVGSLLSSNRPLYELDEAKLRGAAPDVIITQDLCDVCAITPPQLQQVVRSLSPQPRLVPLTPHRLTDILDDVVAIGRALEQESRALDLKADLQQRIERVQHAVAGTTARPRVACLEWLSPLYAAGHWVPDMVAAAGGVDVLALAGQPSRRIAWTDLRAADPDVILLMPCGFTIARTTAELSALTEQPDWNALRAVRNGLVYVVDALSFFSRPGPRLVDGVEFLGGILHPDRTPSPPAEAAARLEALTPLAVKPT